MHRADERCVSRRRFLLQGAAAAATFAAGNRLLRAAEGPRVVILRDKSRQVVQGMTVNADIVQTLVDKAVMALAGKDDIAKAWGVYVGPADKVAVKFNGLFANATTHPEVIFAVTNGLIKAGVDPAKIVVFDRSEKDFATARLKVSREGAGPRAYPTEKDYDKPTKAGDTETQLSRILTGADVLINLSMLKTHCLAGLSGALKNHLGSVPNANAFHKDLAGIADINALEPIKAKTRICIADGLYGLYNGGPTYRPQFRWDYCGILAATDPVALDATLADIIRAKRVEKGMEPYEKPLAHVARAAELGLGVADVAKLQRVETEI